MFIEYTATRETIGGLAELEIGANPIDRIQKVDQETSVSMSKVGREAQLNAIEYAWQIVTIPFLVDNAGINDLARWREWAASTANDEPFDFDAWGTKASPNDVIQCVQVKGSFREVRFSKLYMQIQLEILELQ